MMTSSNGTIFRVTGPLCGEFTGPRWIPLTKASDAELCCFLWTAPWVNNRESGDLRRHRVHYDVIEMKPLCLDKYTLCFPEHLWCERFDIICALPIAFPIFPVSFSNYKTLCDTVVRLHDVVQTTWIFNNPDLWCNAIDVITNTQFGSEW